MISWTIPGTVASTTGSSSNSYSSTSSQSSTASVAYTIPGGIATESYSGSTTSSYVSTAKTVVDRFGSTTVVFSSYTYSSVSEYSGTGDLEPDAQTNPANSYNGPTYYGGSSSVSSSSSTSGETISVPTALKATSTTSTNESYFYVYSYVGTVSIPTGEFELPVNGWTYSTDSNTTAIFGTEVSTTTSYEEILSTREITEVYTTHLAETLTLSGLPNTVVQAELAGGGGQQDEILYAIQDMPTFWNGYSAATDAAQSGTRFTLVPKIYTIPKPSMSASSPVSTTQYPSFLSNVNFSTTSFSSGTITSASYFFFPPQTGTRTVGSYVLQSSTAAVEWESFDESYGNGATTISQTEYFSVPVTVRRQTQTQTYSASTSTTYSRTIPSTILAAVTFTTTYASSGTLTAGTNFASGSRTTAEASGSTIYAEGNTVIEAPRANTGQAIQFGRTKYCTLGGVIGTQTGGWITANGTSEGYMFDLYVKNGAGRSGTTVFPQTNQYETVYSDSITWTTTTEGTSEATESTTSSAVFGVEGEPAITVDARPLSVFGGYPTTGQTIVERPDAGVFKDRINGSTSSFTQGDVVVSSSPLKMWFPIRHIGPVTLSVNQNPVTWTEHRNSSLQLPPNTPQA